MGGYGSGGQFGKNLTDDYLMLDVRKWQRDGLFVPGIGFNVTWSSRGQRTGQIGVSVQEATVRLTYNCRQRGAEWERLDYPVAFTTTPCHYGGVRYWFICPALGCGKRVAILYQGDKYFACRHCYRLAYPSQREASHDRLIRKADKLREKLVWEPGVLNGGGWKPKGMHWKTYWRLKAEHDYCVENGMNGLMASLDQNFDKVAKNQLPQKNDH